MELRLIRFSEVKEKSFFDYIDDWETSGEMIIPYAASPGRAHFSELIKKWEHHETVSVYEKNLVPATLYFLIDSSDYILGAIHFRHKLNDNLLLRGGHIGYGIRPSERKKGYATIMLSQLLNHLAKKGYITVMLSCDDSNRASISTIEKAGGVLQDKSLFKDTLTRRYWIEIGTGN